MHPLLQVGYVAAALLAICGASAGSLRIYRWGRKNVNVLSKIVEVLLGREAILHPDTEEVLVPETLGIGARMSHMEEWQTSATQVLANIASSQALMAKTNERVDTLETRFDEHIAECAPGA